MPEREEESGAVMFSAHQSKLRLVREEHIKSNLLWNQNIMEHRKTAIVEYIERTVMKSGKGRIYGLLMSGIGFTFP